MCTTRHTNRKVSKFFLRVIKIKLGLVHTFVGISKTTVFQSDLIHIQSHMQAVRPCQVDAKPKSGDITYMREEKLANQKPEENWKRHIPGNGSTTTVAQHEGESYMWMTIKLSYL